MRTERIEANCGAIQIVLPHGDMGGMEIRLRPDLAAEERKEIEAEVAKDREVFGDDSAMALLLEDATSNGWEFIANPGDVGFAMTSFSILSDNITLSDHSKWLVLGPIWHDNNPMMPTNTVRLFQGETLRWVRYYDASEVAQDRETDARDRGVCAVCGRDTTQETALGLRCNTHLGVLLEGEREAEETTPWQTNSLF